MRRGTLVTVAGGADYAGKPRPALIVQSDAFETRASLTVCPLTTREVPVPFIRLWIPPTAENGLDSPSWVMIDKIQTLPCRKVGKRVGEVTAEQMRAVTEALAIYLGIAEREPA